MNSVHYRKFMTLLLELNTMAVVVKNGDLNVFLYFFFFFIILLV